ncbi:MAG TPA: BREX protein BrxB domain-containing protein [Gemmataceae bacterium]|nr:BREX protein BrxB domain-containing protein [Gemmataceae bacterium]
MSWDNEAWERFLDTVVQIAQGRRHDWRNSFVLHPYDPGAERDALVAVHNARSRIEACQLTFEVLSWGAFVADFLRKQGFLRQSVSSEDDSARLQRNLANRLPEYLAERTEQALQGKGRTHVAVIVRTGAIFPFTTTSQTLAACESRRVQATLAVLGPGRVTDRGRSFGLLNGPPHPGYPALIVAPQDNT